MRAPRISLCMIVRDEAENLPRALDSVKDAVDEIVVVDTGSKDESPRVAQEHGARVIHHEWKDDFSEARNRSLAEARGEWALILDADEELQAGSAALIRKAVSDPRAAGYQLRLVDLDDKNRLRENLLLPRLFRLEPEIRFVNVIHEQILSSLLGFARSQAQLILSCEATLIHYGYRPAEVERKGKKERNLRLFRKQLAARPEDPYLWYKFADFLRPFDEQGAKAAIAKAFGLLSRMPSEEARAQVYGAEVCAFHGFALLHEGRGGEALAMLKAAADRYAPTPNFAFALACVSLKQGETETSLQAFRNCLSFGGKTLPVPVQPGITGPIAHFGIGESLRALGRKDEAERAYRQAIALLPGYPQATRALSDLMQEKD